ncbi:MAG: hypothetical protein V4444_08735 [Pseudomonadota bacterium]
MIVLAILAAAAADALSNVDVLTAQVIGIYRECAVDKSLRLDDGKESVEVLAQAGLTACSEIRPKLLDSLTMGLMHRVGMPDTDENWSRARDSAREELVTVDQYIANKAQLALLEKRAEKKKS